MTPESPPNHPERVVVVGAGLAGMRTVEALRAQGYHGRITLLGAEAYPPYDRPPLSKAVLHGAIDDTALRPSYDDLDVELLLGQRATGLRDGVVETDRGELTADAVVVATGASPRELPGVTGRPGVHLLRTIDDARALRRVLGRGRRLVVVGAGWIGAEVATAAVAAGCSVTVVEAAEQPIATALGVEVGAATVPWYAEAGVDLRLGVAVDGVAAGAVHLADGERLPADAVVVGVGVVPDVGWLAGSGIELSAGAIATDDRLRTSRPGVLAVGDCAAYWSSRYAARLAVQHWDDALRGPDVVASTLMGGDAVHDPVPYFWSEQFGRTLQVVGYHRVADELLWRGSPGEARWAVAWLRAGVLVALAAADRPRDVSQARRLIAAGASPDRELLADPDVPVKATLRGVPPGVCRVTGSSR